MTTHEQVAQDLPLYALGTLDDEDRRAVEDHLRECARCRFELHLLREDMSRLALRGPESDEDSPTAGDSAPMITLDETEAPSSSSRLYWLAAVPVVLCMVLGAMVVQLRTQNMEMITQQSGAQSEITRERSLNEHARLVDTILHDSSSVHMASVGGAGEIQVLFNASLHRALLVGSHLPRPNSPLVYQLWLIPNEGRPVNGGTFVPDASGGAFIVSPQLSHELQTASFEVTTETQPGAPAPTGLPVYTGK